MIGRYALSPMKELWSQEEKYKRWLEVEIAVVRAMEDLGKAPKGTFEKVKNTAKIGINNILEIEKILNYDEILFIMFIS
jgi:adenylosuccinate lyase